MTSSDAMRAFWDARAREQALYFVDARRAYGDTDLESFWASGESDLTRLLELAQHEIPPHGDVLEIGCGAGRMTRAIAARAGHVVALDVSGAMLERARALTPGPPGADWRLGDGTTLAGIADASVDACISFATFQHVPDPRVTLGYIREVGRVLRPGGWAALQLSTDPNAHAAPGPHPRGRLLRRPRGPQGLTEPEWVGAPVDLLPLGVAAHGGGLEIERIVSPGTRFSIVCTQRAGAIIG